MADTAVQGAADGERSPSVAHATTSTDADRIHLSQREVEQVIARAVELQQEREVHEGVGLTLGDVRDVARQVGVPPAVVRRALDEVRLRATDPSEPGWADRLLGPEQVVGAAVVQGDPDAVSRAIAAWMTDDEGMVLAGTRDGADRWVPDKRILTQVRHGLQVTRSDSALRGLRGVATRTTTATDGALVAVEADTSSIRTTNAIVLSVGGVVGLGVGVATAALVPDAAPVASDLAQFVGGFAVPAGISAGVTALVHRSWLGRVRRAVVQALDGISMTARDGASRPSGGSLDWRTVRRRWLGGG